MTHALGPRPVHELLAELDEAVALANATLGREPLLAAPDQPATEFRDLCIGLVVGSREPPWNEHPYWGPVVRVLRGGLVDAGCDLLTHVLSASTDFADPLRPSFAQRALDRGVDGIVVASLQPGDPELAEVLEADIPAIVIDDDRGGPRLGWVQSDNFGGMVAVVEHLASLGRTRIAHVAGFLGSSPAAQRLAGFRAGLAQLGLEARLTYLEGGDWAHRTGYEAAQRLLALPEPPDAITAAGDFMALGVLAALEDAGVRVPEDVAVAGFDGSLFAARSQPGLTTVRQDTGAIARASVTALLGMIERPDLPPPHVRVPVELVVRGSTAA
jgi:LacI family transcriptional regulator